METKLQIDTLSDNEKMKSFMLLGNKYNFFETIEGLNIYKNIGAISMLAFLTNNFPVDKVTGLLAQCAQNKKFDFHKFSDVFRLIYKNYLTDVEQKESQYPVEAIHSEIIHIEEFTPDLGTFTPNLYFLPTWYNVIMDQFRGQGGLTAPFHESLNVYGNKEIKSDKVDSNSLIIKGEIMNDLNLGGYEKKFIQDNREYLENITECIKTISSIPFKEQKFIFMYLIEMKDQNINIKDIEVLLKEASTSGDYFEVFNQLYLAGIKYAQMKGVSGNSQVSGLNAALEYNKKNHDSGAKIMINDMIGPNPLLFPELSTGFCKFVESNGMSFHDILRAI